MRTVNEPPRAGSPAAHRLRGRMHRGAFSLVELLVVIAIVAILSGLLLVGIQGATRAGRIAAASADIDDVSSALEAFNQKYGTYPPSSLVLHESVALFDGAAGAELAAQSESVRELRRIWPQFDYRTFLDNTDGAVNNAGVFDINQDGDTGDTVFLNGAECLVFFLGGRLTAPQSVADGVNSQATTGFSANPLSPLDASGNARVGPFAEFDSGRFTDIDQDGMPEYVDAFPNQTRPYAYFRSNGQGYRPQGADGIWGTDDDETITIVNDVVGPFFPYFKNAGTQDVDLDGDMTDETIPSGVPYAQKNYQLISPGPDGEFGIGGPLISGDVTDSLPAPDVNYSINVDGTQTTFARDETAADPDLRASVERDNMASFFSGVFQP